MTSNYGYPVSSSRFPMPIFPFTSSQLPLVACLCPVLSSLSLLAFPLPHAPSHTIAYLISAIAKKKNSLEKKIHISFVLAVVAEACSSTFGLPLAESLLSHSEMRKRLSLIVYRSRLSLASHLALCLCPALALALVAGFNNYSTIS